jgi:hypothetical protein
VSGALDTMTAEDKAAFDQMAAADAEPWPHNEPEPEPQAVEQPEAAPAAEPAATDKPQPKHVPLEELLKERKARQAASAAQAELEKKYAADMARLQERLELLTAAVQQPVAQPAQPAVAEAEAPVPDPERDPMGYVRWNLDRIARQHEQVAQRVAQVEQFAQHGQQQNQQQQQIQALVNWGQAQEAAFAQQQPDYQQAIAHLRATRARELAAVGITAPAEVNAAIAQDSLGLARMAQQRGVNFGRALYDMALARGYTPPVASEQPSAPAVDPVARATRGADMAAGLPSGTAPRGEPTAQALANMSEAQFAAYLAKVGKNPTAIRAIFGD